MVGVYRKQVLDRSQQSIPQFSEQCSKHVVTISLTYSIGLLLFYMKVSCNLKGWNEMVFWAMLTRLQWIELGKGWICY